MHTRKSDEELLIEFVADQGWSQPDLVVAAARLKECIEKELQDYSISEEQYKDETKEP